MKLEDLQTIEQLSAFLAGTQAVAFSLATDKDTTYRWIQRTLTRFQYWELRKVNKGIVCRFAQKVSGYSRPQIVRLIAQYRKTGSLARRQRTTAGFVQKYGPEDIRLLAAMDERHDTPNGATLKKLCERAVTLFGESEYAKLANISVSHLYNLRKSKTYQQRRRTFSKTQSRACIIGERRKPQPDGKPGYLRIDTVHQGDLDGKKGLYHINAVDEVTQFEIVVAVEKISEAYLLPALETILEGFPFPILGFHSDNGKEYINHRVAKLLDKLAIEQTKSRARQSNDNALAESKNGAVVRAFLGYSHIPQVHAQRVNEFLEQQLNPYLNYHRPCFFPETITDDKGKERKCYPYKNLMTPYEKLKSLPEAEQYLKPAFTWDILDSIANTLSDNQAADQIQKARQLLFKTIHDQNLKTG